MPDAVETKEVEIGTLSAVDYNKARAEGKTTVAVAVEPEVVEETEKSAEEEVKTTEEKPKQKGWNGAQKKIDRLVREKAEAEERAQRAEARNRELEGKTAKTEPEKTAPDPNARPLADNFKTFEEYIEALADWKVEQKLRTESAAAEAEEEKEIVQGVLETYKERVNQTRAKYEDFDDVVTEDVKSPWPEKNPSKMDLAAASAFQTAVFEDENAGEIQYYYGKHPDEFLKLGGLTPAQVVKAVARLSDKLTAEIGIESDEKEEVEEEKVAPKIVSKSAPPIKPVNSGATRSTVPLDKMSPRDYEKARAAGRVR